MKFKTREKFNEKYSYGDSYSGPNTNMIVEEVFDSIAERVEFYKRYAHNYEAFLIEETELKIPKEIRAHDMNANFYTYWHPWLFDYCFGDVIE